MESTNIPTSSSQKIASAPDLPQPHPWRAKRLLLKSFKRPDHLVVLGILCLDLLFKYLALHQLPLNQPLWHFWLFDIMLFKNPGIAFGIPLHGLVSIALSIILLGYFMYAYVHTDNDRLRLAAYCIILGALSNFLDRVLHGYVTDYLLLWAHSAINLADILILSGLFLHIKYSRSIN